MMPPMGTDAPTLEWDTVDRLKKALRFADVPVAEMADYLGVSRNTVSRYINDHVTPDRRTLRLWAIRCDVPYEWLVHGETATITDSSSGLPVTGTYDLGDTELIKQFRRELGGLAVLRPGNDQVRT